MGLVWGGTNVVPVACFATGPMFSYGGARRGGAAQICDGLFGSTEGGRAAGTPAVRFSSSYECECRKELSASMQKRPSIRDDSDHAASPYQRRFLHARRMLPSAAVPD